MRKAGLDFMIEPAGRMRAQGAEPRCEAKFASLSADKVKDRQAVLVVMEPKAPPELLEVHGQALSWPKEHDRIDLRNVDPLVVEIDDEDDVDLTANEALPRGPAFIMGTLS